MERVNFNPEWYGVQAKVLSRSERQMVVDYGCMDKNHHLYSEIKTAAPGRSGCITNF